MTTQEPPKDDGIFIGSETIGMDTVFIGRDSSSECLDAVACGTSDAKFDQDAWVREIKRKQVIRSICFAVCSAIVIGVITTVVFMVMK